MNNIASTYTQEELIAELAQQIRIAQECDVDSHIGVSRLQCSNCGCVTLVHYGSIFECRVALDGLYHYHHCIVLVLLSHEGSLAEYRLETDGTIKVDYSNVLECL